MSHENGTKDEMTNTNSIRPVIQAFPANEKILEDSNLPFGVTITPLGEEDDVATPVQSLTGITKCIHCGSPHVCANTHFLLGNLPGTLLCYLCGRTSDITTSTHAKQRQRDMPSQIFALPLRLGTATPQYEVSAEKCPPLWIIVLDGSCSDRRYWTLVSQTLQSILATAPPYVKIALLTATTRQGHSTWGVFNLASPIPSISHGPNVPLSFAPAHSPHITTAIRSLVDYVPLLPVPKDGCPLFWVIHSILEHLQTHYRLAGDRTQDPHSTNAYAGAKVTAWLTSCPAHVARRHPPTADDGEWTPSALSERYQPYQTEAAATLGRACADAGVGVDIVLSSLRPEEPVDFGLPLFGALAERSGAPAPVVLSDVVEEVVAEVVSRTPWREGCVFAAELRLRLPPGYGVEKSDDGDMTEAGLVGSASDTGSSQLWRMGTCHPFAAVSVDLAITQRSATDVMFVPGFGEVALRPVIQTCVAYTTCLQRDDGSYVTVRQMRIASRSFPLARTVEGLYAAVDPEVLAVVLFSKLSLASAQDGRIEAALMAKQWTQLLLTSLYRSAEDEFERQKANKERGVETMDWEGRYFVPSERLLHLDGELSTSSVLLGAGHERLRRIVLMVYLLLQSDPLRVSSEWSMDERWAMTSLMMSASPSVLTRTIAPRLQLWESGGNVPILDVLDLRSEAVQTAILEHSRNGNSHAPPGLILLLDTPREIVAMDARFVNSDSKVKSMPGLSAGQSLVQAMEDTATSYRTRPRLVYELDQASTSGEQTLTRLLDCLVEDTENVALGCANFEAFETQLAEQLEK